MSLHMPSLDHYDDSCSHEYVIIGTIHQTIFGKKGHPNYYTEKNVKQCMKCKNIINEDR